MLTGSCFESDPVLGVTSPNTTTATKRNTITVRESSPSEGFAILRLRWAISALEWP